MPESMEELEKQIADRYKDDEASVNRRINKAKMEMELAPLFRNVVKNTDHQAAYQEIKEIILAELEKRKQKN